MSSETIQYFGKDLEAMSFAHNYHEWLLDEISPFLTGNVAEVGAGMGNFSDFILSTGVNYLTAFEPSENMYPLLEKRFADNKKVETVSAFFEDQSRQYKNSFDSVLYINVLEHIEDDKNALVHTYETIKPGGHVLIFVPALAFLYSDLDKELGHFRRYSKQSLVDVVEAAGFTVNMVKYFDIAGIIPWYIAFVLLKHTTTEGNVSAYDKLVVPIMRRVEQVITPFIGKNLLLVASK